MAYVIQSGFEGEIMFTTACRVRDWQIQHDSQTNINANNPIYYPRNIIVSIEIAQTIQIK